MASGEPKNAGTASYVTAPQNVQSEQTIDEQLSQLKISAKKKINDLVDSSKQQFENARNNPGNRDSGNLVQDAGATTNDATQSYNTALQQLGEAFHTAETTGKQVAQQLTLARDHATVGAQDLTGAARQEAQQRSQDAQHQIQGGKSALQQGIATVQAAFTQGAAVANQTLQGGVHGGDTVGPNSVTTQSKTVQAGDPLSPTLFQSVTALISSTALSVKEALVGKSTPTTTASANNVTPTTTNDTVTHPPAQTVTESIGQSFTALKDVVKDTLSPPPAAQPANNVNPGLPADVPHKASN